MKYYSLSEDVFEEYDTLEAALLGITDRLIHDDYQFCNVRLIKGEEIELYANVTVKQND